MVVLFQYMGIACVIYYICLFANFGIEDTQYSIWLLLAILCFALSYIQFLYQKKDKRIPLWFIVSIYTLTTVGIFVYIIVQTMIFTSMIHRSIGDVDYLIVIGGECDNGELQETTKYKLDDTMRYIQSKPDTLIVLSGGKQKEQGVSRAEIMAKYLLDRGVNPDLLLIEVESHNTRESVLYSKALIRSLIQMKRLDFKHDRVAVAGPVFIAPEEKPESIGIITNDIHLCRTKLLAQKIGFQELTVFFTKTEIWLYPHFIVREIVLILRDKFMGYL